MGIVDRLEGFSNSGGFVGLLLRLFLRFFQFILGIVVIGLYAVDLHHADELHAYTDGKWVFAVLVGSLSAVTCLVYAIPFFKTTGASAGICYFCKFYQTLVVIAFIRSTRLLY